MGRGDLGNQVPVLPGLTPALPAGLLGTSGAALADLAANVGGLLGHEWQRLNQGLSGLTPSGREQGRQDRLNELIRERGEQNISMPGWDDIIHLGPLSGLTAAEQLARTREIGERIRSSPQDATARSWGEILTALDNVQDLMTTIAVAGRLVLWPAGKILGRAIPGVGTVLLIGDILKLLTLLGTLLMPIYGLACGNPRGFFAGLGQVAAFGPRAKGMVENLSRLNPFGSMARASRALRATRLVPGAGEIVEVLQTTDQLFGWGVSFGAVVGLLGDAIYGTANALAGSAPTINTQNLTNAGARLPGIGSVYQGADQASMARQAAGVLATLPAITNTQQPLTWEEHAGAIVAGIAAVDILAAELAGSGWQELARDLAGARWAWPLTPFPTVAGVIAADGRAPTAALRWPVPGNPERVTFEELTRYTAGESAARARELTANTVDTIEGSLIAALMGAFVERVFAFVWEDPRALAWELTPPYKVAAALVLANRLANVGEDPDRVAGWFQDAVQATHEQDGRYLDQEQLDQLAERRGIALIQTAPPHVGGPESLTIA